MHERPILMTADSVLGLLADRKSQSRRAFHWPLTSKSDGTKRRIFLERDIDEVRRYISERQRDPLKILCPYGQIKDKLWIKETWGYRGSVWHSKQPDSEEICIVYRADDERRSFTLPNGVSKNLCRQRPQRDDEPEDERHEYLSKYWKSWRSPIFMPRWASRITLEITDVRVERVQDISDEDCRAEGCTPFYTHKPCKDQFCPVHHKEKDDYRKLWDSINGKSHPFSSNPWVWVIEFKKVEN
jgi:hypothetical protein